jgi:uncharacterized membrane protein
VIVINSIILWLHLVSAMFFVGGSLFVWWVLIPAASRLTKDESRRTEIVGTVARGFGKILMPTIGVLVATGIYNATWYLHSFGELFRDARGLVLLTKIVLTLILIGLIGLHDMYFSRKIARLAAEKKSEELQAVRRWSHILSAAIVLLMAAVIALAVALGALD